MDKIVIFGCRDLASLAHFYFTNDSPDRVVAFTVDRQYLKEETFEGKPVIPFEELPKFYPPSGYKLFAPIYAKRMNADRIAVYERGRQLGYRFATYLSSKTVNYATAIGDNCFILEGNILQPFTTIGNDVIMWSANHLGHHGRIEDHVFITGHVCISGHCLIKSRSFIAPNCTLRDHLTIGEGCLVGMGSVVTKDTEPWSVYLGNPARKTEADPLTVNL